MPLRFESRAHESISNLILACALQRIVDDEFEAVRQVESLQVRAAVEDEVELVVVDVATKRSTRLHSPCIAATPRASVRTKFLMTIQLEQGNIGPMIEAANIYENS